MVEGRIASYAKASGPNGAFAYSTAVDRVVIGAGATKKLGLGLTTPYYGEGMGVKSALLDLGMVVPPDTPMPLRVLVNVDGVTVTREFKPQVAVEVEEGVYGKAVYDATALLASKLTKSDLHRLSIVYTAARHVTFEDAGLAVVYTGVDGGWFSYNMLSGAVVLEPGDILAVDVDLPESRVDSKNVVVKMHVPSRFADIRVEVSGRSVDAGGVTGPSVIEIPVRSRGSKLRVYIYYEKPEQSFYPKKAVLSTIVAYETLVPAAKVAISDLAWEGEALRVRLENTGTAVAEDVRVMAFASGVTVARLDLGSLEPGGDASVELRVDTSRIPREADELLVRVMWRSYGRPGISDKRVSVGGRARS